MIELRSGSVYRVPDQASSGSPLFFVFVVDLAGAGGAAGPAFAASGDLASGVASRCCASAGVVFAGIGIFEFEGCGGGAPNSTPGTPSGKSGLRTPGSGGCFCSNGFNLSNVSQPAIANPIDRANKAEVTNRERRDMKYPIA
jgi:hypothetical protein